MSSEAQLATDDAIAKKRIGWIGAGKMGAPMLRNLLAKGIDVWVTEPSQVQTSKLVSAGATATTSLADHEASDIVFATLPNDPVLLDIVFGHGEQPALANVLSPNAVFVEMSTVSPDCSAAIAEKLQQHSIRYLRAPLSGSTELAEQATLTILASGDEEAWMTALPFMEVMSAQQFYLGASEEARYMKLVLNTLVGSSSALLSEALALGASGGLSHASMMKIIGSSAVSSPLYTYKSEAVVSGDYTAAFSIEQMIKDFTLISEAARAQQVPLFTTGLILELYRAAANSGLKDKDFFALVKWHAEMNAS